MDLGPRLADTYDGVLRHVLALHPPGIALEFGVAAGRTLRMIAERMPVVGWRSPHLRGHRADRAQPAAMPPLPAGMGRPARPA